MARSQQNRPSTSPRQVPQSTTNTNESREIIRLAQSRKVVYPKLTLDNFATYGYKELVGPLKKHPNEILKIQKDFLKNMLSVETMLGDLALSNFSYDKAKSLATKPSDKALFRQLDAQMNIIRGGVEGGTVGTPNLEALFGAKTQTEFDSNMVDTNIVQKAYSNDNVFRSRAQKIFNYIKAYRSKHRTQLRSNTVNNYLSSIFNGKEDEIEDRIENSTIINPSLLNDGGRKSKIIYAYRQYLLYRKRLNKHLQTAKLTRESTKSSLSTTIEYAKSGEHYVAKKIQDMRDHWAGMDGKEKVVAGLTMLIGTAFFLNSQNENVQKTRDALIKAGLIAIGYIGLNTTSKVLFGKSLSHMTKSHIKDKSGKRDFLKKSFDTDKTGAENIDTSLAVLGNEDFTELAQLYLKEEARCKKFNIADKLRGVSVGGVAEHEMSPHTIYLVMKLLDRKLQKRGSSIQRLLDELKKTEAEAKSHGKTFIRPNWAMIITAVLQDQKFGYSFDKEGNVKLRNGKEILTKWDQTEKEKTDMWWPLTQGPSNWRIQTVDNKPKAHIETNQLNRLSSTIISPTTPLSGVINTENLGRFVRGFNVLYANAYSKHPSKAIHTFEDTGYITSKTKVDTITHGNKTAARISSVQSAYQQAMKGLKDKINANPNHPLKHYVNRLSEFVQPVFGTFIGKSRNTAKEYVMFLRLVLPGSAEFKLRDRHEWADGNMMKGMHEKPIKSGDRLTRADFSMLKKRKPKAFKGAYESFLAKAKLTKAQTDEADKMLEYYSKHFANSGMTKLGLVRYLATHEFTDAEIREARGLPASAELANKEVATYAMIKEATLKARILAPTNAKRAEILNTFGNIVILASHGDKVALQAIKALDPSLEASIQKFINSKKITALSTFSSVIASYIARVEGIYGSGSIRNIALQTKIRIASEEYFSIDK